VSDPILVGATHLFAGYAKENKNGDPEFGSGSLEPVRNVILLTSGLGFDDKPELLVPWKSDDKGLLYAIGKAGQERNTPVHFHGNTRRFHLAPPAVFLSMWAAYREQWAAKLSEVLKENGAGPNSGVELVRRSLKKHQLRRPDQVSGDESDRTYVKWYDSIGDGTPFYGFVIPKVRGLVLTLPNGLRFEAIKIALPGGTETHVDPVAIDKQNFAVVTGDEKTLPSGLYTFTVKADQDLGLGWNAPLRGSKSYTIKEMVRFGITNFAGEFDVVSGDPISVEEAVMLQFPTLYAHTALRAKRETMHPDMAPEFHKEDKVPPAPKEWTERLGWAHERAKFTVEMVNADGGSERGQLLGKALLGAIGTNNTLVKNIRDGVDLAFSGHKVFKDWKDLIKAANAEKELKALQVDQLLWTNLESTWKRFRWWKYVQKEWVEGKGQGAAKILRLSLMDQSDLKTVLDAGVPRKFTKLQKAVGKVGGARIGASIAVAGTALEVLNAAVATNEYFETVTKTEDFRNDFSTLIQQVTSKLNGVPCREGIGNLERLRGATIASGMDLDAAEGKALMAAMDVVLGVLCVVGIGEVAIGALALVRSAAGLLVSVSEYLDRVLCDGWTAERFGGQMYDLAKASRVNQKELAKHAKEKGVEDLHVQFLLRAEALAGLVALLTRAGVASSTREKYEERLQKYKVKEYIEQILLGGGWSFPVKPLIPIGLDQVWLQMSSPFADVELASVGQQLGYGAPAKIAAAALIPGGMSILSVANEVLANHVSANYHRSFPIHRMESQTIEELGHAFRTRWRELDKDSIEYTCIYWRPRNSGPEVSWRQVNHRGIGWVESLPILSPFDQIRILVVLKETVKGGPYPVSLQLCRVDGLNISGPVYREVTRVLGDEIIPGEEKYKTRLGCVFHPFYQFGAQVFPGIKPLARGADLLGPEAIKFLGWLSDMRYAFELRLGNATSGPWVKLGGLSTGQGADLDELRMGIGNDPDEKKLLVNTFLTSLTETFEYPRLIGSAHGTAALSMRVGGKGSYRLLASEQVAFHDYDWQQSVELVFLVWVNHIDIQGFLKEDLDWTRLPVQFELVENSGFTGTAGPTYQTKLEYLGVAHAGTGQIQRLPVDGHALQPPGPEVAEWLAEMQADPRRSAVIAGEIDGPTPQFPTNHVYAAHLSLTYRDPRGEPHVALRPFGRLLLSNPGHPQLYRIGIHKIRLPDKIGARELSIRGSASFKAPVSKQPPFQALGEDDYKKWIEKGASKLDPTLELVATH
jgi:hypothetical protein